MLDSFGKPPSGILEGALLWPGAFRECINIIEPTLNWTSKFCTLTNKISQSLRDQGDPEVILRYGICVPKGCTERDIAQVTTTGKRKLFTSFSILKHVVISTLLVDLSYS